MYTESDKVLLKYLAEHFINKGGGMMTSDLEALDCYSEESINKLRTLNLVKYDTDITLKIYPSIVSEKNKLEALPDHYQDLKKWWFSKKWAVIFTVLFLVLPAIKTYIDLVGLLFK
ncbi:MULTISPECIES: hypothetical protein [Pseudoalteromonas]|jgi:hypothetical protein|uniref:hypothetical protein n=1 Tax=Pseudoalteromonas TaxID=53246 RepID=UPI0003D62004|nr:MULTISPECIES: hypothetical protein [Pseudoalteromonas]ETJ48238.1 hypothetical protein X564_11950 [Pseudoalteromonas agarivorans]MDC9499464.1 hypothetical protein [Pseudoalteromonas sp. Angola-20]MDC9519089.1 hypothetical protein [Pseudoalteromonas sp. Angola-22]MDC9535471.1 hypothetical protein [Pseudoalteromonas sp. Angola-9]TMP79031.1 hypothetical protein CWB71_16535 [Pseudoalteromonas sp. S983]